MAALIVFTALGFLVDAGWLAIAATAAVVSLTNVSGPEWVLETGWKQDDTRLKIIELTKGGQGKGETSFKKAS